MAKNTYAFPQSAVIDVDGVIISSDCYDSGSAGMTLRDYFAAKSLPAVIGDPWYADQQDKEFKELAPHIANDAYTLADAMLKARES